jgi:hypothetical protein
MGRTWREFAIVSRIVDVAVVFDLNAKQLSYVRAGASAAGDRLGFLEAVLRERTLTPKSVMRCALFRSP